MASFQLNNMAMYDASATPVQFGGNSNINLTGNIYAPTADVTFQGNPTIDLGGGTGCGELIAKSVAFNGNATLDGSGCPLAVYAPTYEPVCAVGAMMRKLDQRGVAALEFCLVAVPLFTLMFVIFDLGRYTITVQSLHALADAGARATMVGTAGSTCYTDAAITKTTPTCSGDPLPSDAAKKAVAPFLYAGGLTPTLNTAAGAASLTVTASQLSFTMLMPIWGTAFNAPSASTSIPF